VPYRLKLPEAEVLGVGKFKNSQGHTECAEFIRQATNAPSTPVWKKGRKVSEANLGDILRGTAIATFDDAGRYPTDALGRHAAIYLSHTSGGISVLDQWNAQGEVKPRLIQFNKPKGTSRSNDGSTFFVIE